MKDIMNKKDLMNKNILNVLTIAALASVTALSPAYAGKSGIHESCEKEEDDRRSSINLNPSVPTHLSEPAQNRLAIKDDDSPDEEYKRIDAKFKATPDEDVSTNAQFINVWRAYFSDIIKCVEKGSTLAAENISTIRWELVHTLCTTFPEDFSTKQKIAQVKEASVLMLDAVEAKDSPAIVLFDLGDTLYGLSKDHSNNEEAIILEREAIELVNASAVAGHNEARKILPIIQYELGLSLKDFYAVQAHTNEEKLSYLREALCLLEESLKNDHKDEVAFTLAATKNKLAKALLDSVKTSLLTNQSIVREAARLIASDGLTTSPTVSFNHARSDGRRNALFCGYRKLSKLISIFKAAIDDVGITSFSDLFELSKTLYVLHESQIHLAYIIETTGEVTQGLPEEALQDFNGISS
ncbi:MAG: hypothetical protein F9K49_07030, partial [Caedimonadaceae bacterium]